MADNAPSFIASTLSGMKGYAKGLLTGLGFGAAVGGAIGAVIGALTTGVGAFEGALVGAKAGAMLLGSVGALSGAITEVVRAREPSRNAEELAAVANISYSQGVARGMEAQKEQTHAPEKADTKWRDKRVNELAARAVAKEGGHAIS